MCVCVCVCVCRAFVGLDNKLYIGLMTTWLMDRG